MGLNTRTSSKYKLLEPTEVVSDFWVSLVKGDNVYIPIVAMNRLKEIWGEDAMEFRSVNITGSSSQSRTALTCIPVRSDGTIFLKQ